MQIPRPPMSSLAKNSGRSQEPLLVLGGAVSTLGTPSSSWILPSNVRVRTLSSATSG